jgi:hypothetical protein
MERRHLMRFRLIVLLALICVAPATLRAAPEEGPVEQYRAYVKAVRAGKLDDVVKLIEPVPDTSKPLLNARVKQAIAVEAMKKEMLAQMGPPKAGEDGWEIGGLPYDDVLKNLRPVVQDANIVGLTAIDPRSKAEGVIGWMVRRTGKWMVPAGLVMDLEPAEEFVEPDASERDEKIRYADATAKAADAVLNRLKTNEFKKPAEVLRAFGDEMQKAKP